MQNVRRPDDFSTYLEAHQHAFAWAEKAMALRSAAKIAEAQAAANAARHWLRFIKELERQELRSAFH
jgi:hypothetical protein